MEEREGKEREERVSAGSESDEEAIGMIGEGGGGMDEMNPKRREGKPPSSPPEQVNPMQNPINAQSKHRRRMINDHHLPLPSPTFKLPQGTQADVAASAEAIKEHFLDESNDGLPPPLSPSIPPLFIRLSESAISALIKRLGTSSELRRNKSKKTSVFHWTKKALSG